MTTPTGKQPEHYIETEFKGATYRYYGYAHVPNACSVGEGDWRVVVDGKEVRTNGVIVPGAVLNETARALHAEQVQS